MAARARRITAKQEAVAKLVNAKKQAKYWQREKDKFSKIMGQVIITIFQLFLLIYYYQVGESVNRNQGIAEKKKQEREAKKPKKTITKTMKKYLDPRQVDYNKKAKKKTKV